MPKESSKRTQSQRLSSLLSRTRPPWKNRSILIFTHRQADPDALCAAYALSEFLLRSRGVSHAESSKAERSFFKIIAPQGASQLAASVCKQLSIHFDEKISEDEVERADFIVCVDVGDKHLLEPYLDSITKSKAKKILIDHHSSILGDKENSSRKADLFDYSFLDNKATSTCEIVALGFPTRLLDERLAKILLVGLLYDSQHLGIANEKTLKAALRLVGKGARIIEAKELLRSTPDRSEIIARLKSSQRLRYEEVGKYLLAETEVSSFQAAVARMLVDIGADIGIAFGEHEEEARLSVRTSQGFNRETKIDVGVLISKISKETGMAGGGHSTAASISGKVSPAKVVERVIADLKASLP